MKKRNRLAQKRVNDLVYVIYNRALKAHYDKQEKGDPMALTEIDESNEWLLSEMGADPWKGAGSDLVFENDTLKWGQIAPASSVELPRVATTLQASTSRVLMLVDEENEANAEEIEEGSDESNEECNDKWSDDEGGGD